MFSPLTLILLPLGYFYLWPLVDYLLRKQDEQVSRLLVVLTALVLGAGVLAWVYFWVGLLPGQLITPALTAAIVVGGFMLGLILNPRRFVPANWITPLKSLSRWLAKFDYFGVLLWAVIITSAIIIIYALAYPFISDDVLVRYGAQAQAIYTAHRLPDSVSGYPPLVPFAFVATWFAAGSANEYLARLFPAVMALATVAATYLLGKQAYNSKVGVLAAAFLATTPLFVNNATIAYTDIPTALPLTLAALYTLRWWKTGAWQDSVLSGVMLGIALLVKQSALTWLFGAAVLPIGWLIVFRKAPIENRLGRSALHLVLATSLPLFIAGPWYIRNALVAGSGNILPIAGLYHLLEEGAGFLGSVPFLAWPNAFGIIHTLLFSSGWVAGFIALGLTGWRMLRAAHDQVQGYDLIAALFIVPYWAAWWLRFSFDPRFLLLVLPLVAVWSARFVLVALAWVQRKITIPGWVTRYGYPAVIGVMLVTGVRDRAGGVYWAVTHPLATDAERLEHAKGIVFGLVSYVRENLAPETTRIYVLDERLQYYLPEYDTTFGYPYYLSDLKGYDYIVYSSSFQAIYGDGRLGWQDSEFYHLAYAPIIFEPVYEVDGVYIMRILRTELPTPEEIDAFENRSG